MRMTGLLLSSVLAIVALTSSGQDSAPAPSPATNSVRISFLPPPIDGTLSLGIYDPKGRLVRVLHREADVDEFEIASDSLRTTWDGKNDSGEPLPPGKYHARGYAVGDIAVDGVGYFFNDWIDGHNSPLVAAISAIESHADGFVAVATLASGGTVTLVCDAEGNVKRTRSEPAETRACDSAAGLPGVVDAVDCASGANQTLWVIDRPAKGSEQTEVKQFSAAKELLRRLAIPPGDPQPRSIAVARDQERIFLLEENAAMQRVRGLALVGTNAEAGQAVSDWKVIFEKKIVAHGEFGIENGKPVAGKRRDGPEKITVRLQPNALQDDKVTEVELAAGFDAEGSLLKTADGLPLQRISETPGLRRVVIAKSGEKSLDLFQDNGAVVEQFRVGNLDRMMAFDCGEFELK